jgi:hypothetical protein
MQTVIIEMYDAFETLPRLRQWARMHNRNLARVERKPGYHPETRYILETPEQLAKFKADYLEIFGYELPAPYIKKD